jgi:hypothetical protein
MLPDEPTRQEITMIAFIIKAWNTTAATIVDIWQFTDAVIQDMRQTRDKLEAQYGPLGF